MTDVLSVAWARPGTHDEQIKFLKTSMPERAAELARQYDGERDAGGFETSNVFLCYADEKLVGYIIQELHGAAQPPVLIATRRGLERAFAQEFRNHFGSSSDDADLSMYNYGFEQVTEKSDVSKLPKEKANDIKKSLANKFQVYRLFHKGKEQGYMRVKKPVGEQPMLDVRLDFDVPHKETFQYLRAFRYTPRLGWIQPRQFARVVASRSTSRPPDEDVERAREIEKRWNSVKSHNANLASYQHGETEDPRTYADIVNDYDEEMRGLEAYRLKHGLKSIQEAREAREMEWQRKANAYYDSLPGTTL